MVIKSTTVFPEVGFFDTFFFFKFGSFSLVSMYAENDRFLYPGPARNWKCWFSRSEENWASGEKLRQEQTQPTFGTRPESNSGHIGGK